VRSDYIIRLPILIKLFVLFLDHEMDFFECALHIQTHKRKQAFNQLAKRLNNDEVIFNYYIFNFFSFHSTA